MLQSQTNLSDLRRSYDESYLNCSRAVFYESQGNEDEAMRCWTAALGHISRNQDLRNLALQEPHSETEKALVHSLQQLEIQCKERIDLLEALRLSRRESLAPHSPVASEPEMPKNYSASVADPSSSGWIGCGTIPAITYTDLSRPALPPRPPLPSRQSTSGNSSSGGTRPSIDVSKMTPLRPLDSPVGSGHPSRSPSPDKHTLRTTLRTGKVGERLTKPNRRTDSKPSSEGPGASRAAALAWSALGFRERNRAGSNALEQTAAANQATARPVGREERGSRASVSSRMQWDSHTRRLVASREKETIMPTSTRISVDSNSTPRQASESRAGSDSLSALSVNAAASAVVNNQAADSKQPSLARARRQHAPRQRTAPPSEQPRQVPPSRMDSPGLKKPKERSSSASELPGRRKPVTSQAPSANSAAGAEPQDPYSTKEAAKRESAVNPDATPPGRKAKGKKLQDEFSPSSDESDEGTTADDARTGWTAKKVAAIKNLPPGVDKDAAKQILNEIVVQGDEVRWNDVAGLEIAKAALREAVVYPFLRPDLFMGLREPARGMLLFGPPGTGKTMLARAVATESKSTFFSISASSLTSKYLGESEKLVRALFSLAKLLAPSIIFVDEIDSLLSQRSSSGEHEATRRLKTEFLIQWSDLQRAAAGRDSSPDQERGDPNMVLVLAATNLPWAIDEAARRRFVRRQYIPLPEAKTRETQLKALLGEQKHSLAESDIRQLVEMTDGFSGSDITALAKDAAMGPLRSLGEALLRMTMDEIRPIGFDDFAASLKTIRPSVNRSGLKEYEDWAGEFGERGG